MANGPSGGGASGGAGGGGGAGRGTHSAVLALDQRLEDASALLGLLDTFSHWRAASYSPEPQPGPEPGPEPQPGPEPGPEPQPGGWR